MSAVKCDKCGKIEKMINKGSFVDVWLKMTPTDYSGDQPDNEEQDTLCPDCIKSFITHYDSFFESEVK